LAEPFLAPGTQLGPYEVRSVLGEGGMGVVYRAYDTRLHRDVAVKVLRPLSASDPDRLARFDREARILASLNHPNVATIFGIEYAAGAPAIAMELLDGETVADLIAGANGPGRGLPVAETLGIARQIAEALDAAHERGIVHRDLKPANVLVTRDGLVKVLDFGLARTAAPDADADLTSLSTIPARTSPGTIMGTVAYMSPEQARGLAVDRRTDIWAFGCVLYEMLSGQPAFGRETTSDTLAAILDRAPDLAALPEDTPALVKRVIERCLQKDRKRRARDIADVAADLQTPADPEPPSITSRRRSAAVPVTVTSAVLALGYFSGRQVGGLPLRCARAGRRLGEIRHWWRARQPHGQHHARGRNNLGYFGPGGIARRDPNRRHGQDAWQYRSLLHVGDPGTAARRAPQGPR
jgi:serine/threonine protein kinase